ncbi:hypothetical protein [Mesorhizobium sp.]|uniref:hypothetical protein n=1 Tax=Mesorhizobium sp. TaxID=1871066 RepID=UPI0025841CFA|nr:hypothetical protein [Mesorhizobium sp.]
MQTSDINFKCHRFPPQIVGHAVWLYLRFKLSLHEVEEMLLEHGIDVSYETVGRGTAKFGPQMHATCGDGKRVPSMFSIWTKSL